MLIVTTSEEYNNLELGYYLDCENIADCKYRHTVNDKEIVGLHHDAEQFMVFTKDRLLYCVDCTASEVIAFCKEVLE